MEAFDEMLNDMIILSEQKKKKKRMEHSKYFSYLVLFGEIYKETTGLSFYPQPHSANQLRDVIQPILKENLGVEDFYRWVCDNYRRKIQKYGIRFLKSAANEYLEIRRKNVL